VKGREILEKRLNEALKKGDIPGELLLKHEIAILSSGGERIENLWASFRRAVEEGADTLALAAAIELLDLLEKDGFLDLCEKVFRLLFEIFDDTGAIEMDYAKFLTRSGRFKEAMEIFSLNCSAFQGRKPEISFDNLLHVAAACEGVGERTMAEAIYEKLSGISARFNLERLTLPLLLRLARTARDTKERKKRFLKALDILKGHSDDSLMIAVNEELGDLLAGGKDGKNVLNHYRSALFYARQSRDEVSAARIEEKLKKLEKNSERK